MISNMGFIDRILRMVIGGVLALVFMNGSVAGMPALIVAIVALVFLLTATVGYCPLYSLIGMNSRIK